MTRIFLSYASQQTDLAREFYKWLRSLKHDVFMADASIQLSKDWNEEIRRGLQDGEVFIALVSVDWQNSDWCKYEFDEAKSHSAHIIPIYAVQCPIRSYEIAEYEGIFPDDGGAVSDATALSPLNKRINEAVLKIQPFLAMTAPASMHKPVVAPDVLEYAAPGASTGKMPSPLIIYHCGEHSGEYAPGRRLKDALEDLLGLVVESYDVTQPGGVPKWKRGQTVFVVDSPTANPVARDILLNYQRYIVGTKIRHVTTLDRGLQVQTIRVGKEPFSSNRHTKMLDDRISGEGFDDYLVIMRLPGIVLEGDFSDEAAERTVWLIYGTTQRGSYLGASLFAPNNLRSLMNRLGQAGEAPPSAFEAVFHVPEGAAYPTEYDELGACKLKEPLTSLQDSIRGDPVPTHLGHHLFHGDAYVPISAAHLDLVAACNFGCPYCIERGMRETNCRLSFKMATIILDQLSRQGCKKLSFYGGEPTLHPEFLEIATLATGMGFKPLVVTNGSRLVERKLSDGLKSLADGVRLRVSIDADSQETYVRQHGPKSQSHSFFDIRDAVRSLAEKVNVSISYLVTEDNVRELSRAVLFWKRQSKVRAFIPRIPMGEHGRWRLTAELGIAIRDQLAAIPEDDRPPDWLVLPDWLPDWIRKGGEHRDDLKPELVWRFSQCYSSYYRIAISPRLRPDSQRKAQDEPVETADAWISLCPYHRCEDAYGDWYPTDITLKEWCETKRRDLVGRILPHDCERDGIVCSRVAHNATVQAEINRIRAKPSHAPVPKSA